MGQPMFTEASSAATDFDHPPAAVRQRHPRIVPTASRVLRNRYRRMHVGLLGQSWSGSMRYLLSLMLAVSALGIIPANSEETDLGVCLASLDNAIVVGSNRNDRTDDGRNIALIKEEEFESPEMIAVIERNREDRERTVVIDR